MEKFCLKWNDFQHNVTNTFANLRKQEDLYDVTLVTDDQKQFCSHKIVLASSSDYFQSIIRNSKNQNLNVFIVLSGVESKELEHILDYIYDGEVQLFQHDLDKFLDTAQKFKIKGLTGNEDEGKVEKENFVQNDKVDQLFHSGQNEDSKTNSMIKSQDLKTTDQNISKHRSSNNSIVNESDINVKEIVSQMIYQNGEKWACYDCNKEAKTKGSIELHAEVHINGLIFNCSICNKTFRSRNSYAAHRSKFHSSAKI